tara:strand:+ start:260 stop:1657 length:1398 start_codon:yes stop_codon:yes gene_type:complete
MNRIDNSGTGIAGLGRGEDSMLAHVAPGEMVVPPVISPQTQEIIRREMMSAGLDPSEYTVGQGMSINPITGMAEFGFLKKLAKSVKKVVKKVAPIAAVIPGPWQVPAITYNRGRAVVNLAKGEGGIGDLITAFTPAKSYTGGKTGNIFGNAKEFLTKGSDGVGLFGNIGKGLSNVGDYVFKGSDDVGLLGNLGKSASKAYEYVMPGSDETGLFGNLKKDYASNKEFDELTDGGQDFFDPDFGKVQPNQQSFISKLISGTPGQQNAFQEFMDDQLGFDPGGGGIYRAFGGQNDSTQSGSLLGGLGGNVGLAALAALYGKTVKDDYKRKEGGLKDIRQSVRPDLMPAPTFTGFDLGVRNNAAMGGLQELRPAFAMGRSVMANELDMRMGGPSIGPGTGTSDDIPAMLSDGEFVMTSAANNGLGGFKVTKTETGIELVPNGQPNRQQGAKNMDKLMKTFEQFNKVGMS